MLKAAVSQLLAGIDAEPRLPLATAADKSSGNSNSSSGGDLTSGGEADDSDSDSNSSSSDDTGDSAAAWGCADMSCIWHAQHLQLCNSACIAAFCVHCHKAQDHFHMQ